jgi:subfamily B ATP-binding cassette protein MsbA
MNEVPHNTQTGETRRLIRYVAPYAAPLALGVLLLAVMAALDGLTILSIRPAVDIVLNPGTLDQRLPLFTMPWGGPTLYLNSFVPVRVHYVWSVFSIALLLLFLTKGLSEFFGSMLVQYVGLSAVTDLRNQAYARVVQQPVGFFHDNPVGRVMSAVMNDIEQMRSAFSDYLADFFRQIFTLIAFVLVLLVINWRMAVGSAVLIPVVVWPIGKLARRIRHSTEKSRSGLADLSQILQETISGNRVVKAFGMEGFEIRKFREAARKLLRENMRWIRALAGTSPLMDLLGAAVVCMLLLFARDQIRSGHLAAALVALQFRPRFSKSVESDDARFAYDDGAPLLKVVNLKVRAGTVVAIVGSSGAGKTTLVNLLPRFYTATSGSVRIDGYNVSDVTLRSLREQMAIVTQETILFNDTIWNNLCYGRPEMPEVKVIAAAQAALAHDFITQMPQGYQTMIGDRGQRLSGGQRQRLAIARALLKDAPILILDEATSELDSESEMLVQTALNNLITGRTVFVIAHRLSTIRRADTIAVLENGTIRESGTHDKLLEQGGAYARLHEIQFRDAEPAARALGQV